MKNSKKSKKKGGIIALIVGFGIVVGALVIALNYFSKTITKLIVTNNDLDDENFL